MVGRLVVLISGTGTNLQAIVDACKTGIIQGDVVGVVANKVCKGAEILPGKTKIMKLKNSANREIYDREIAEHINTLTPDLVVLAGWMHLFSKEFLNYVNAQVINLHPALPGAFPGANAIEDSFNSFKAGGYAQAGIMVHDVVEEMDAGKVHKVKDVTMFKNDTLETFKARMKYQEKSLLIEAICQVLTQNLNIDWETQRQLPVTVSKYPLIKKGKVRDLYDLGYNLALVDHSDRLSAFDKNICDIHGKGKLLCDLASWWFKHTRNIIKNHYIYSHDKYMVVKKLEPIPLEIVVRGYIAGQSKTSIWTHYSNGSREYCGNKLPDGLSKNQKLYPIVTPTTKGETDELINPKQIVSRNILTESEWVVVKEKALQLFEFGQKVAKRAGLILVDTKYEFGRDPETNEIILMDEIHTGDSSRYWVETEEYNFDSEIVHNPKSIDKDRARNWLKENPEAKTIPDKIKLQVYSAYEFLNKKFNCVSSETDTMKTDDFADYYFENVLDKLCVIISGSESDKEWCHKIQDKLREQSIYSKYYIASAHKKPKEVLQVIDKYAGRNRKIVYITVAGRSNALSGFVAANSSFPTIACPPFKDRLDMTVNLHSTLQMPSKVPVMTVLDPGNAAIAVKRILN